MKLSVGTRVKHRSGRTGKIARGWQRHGGYGVTFDTKANDFEPDVCRVYGRDLTPLSPKLHEKWEAEWAKAPFIDRSWAAL